MKANQKKVIKLTSTKNNEILIGTDSIIDAVWSESKGCTEIRSRAAMVSTSWVRQTVEEIFEQINS